MYGKYQVSFLSTISEEAVQEVKRQAMIELHKAVASAETKANNMVNQERAKMERTIQEVRKQTREEVIGSINHQEESSEVGLLLTSLHVHLHVIITLLEYVF